MIPLLAAGALAARRATSAPSLSAPWSDINVVSPASTGTNEDRTVSGAGTVTATEGVYPLEYRINSGAWTAYSTGFAITNGQTLGWRATVNDNSPESVAVALNAAPLGSFIVGGIGF